MSTKRKKSDMPTAYDSPWKEIIEIYFSDFVIFFFPAIHKAIDWKKTPVFLDKELQKIVPKSKQPIKYVDKLVCVNLLNGEEKLLYIHIEIQSQQEKHFQKRVYIYNYRLFDLYDQPIATLVILGDKNHSWKPNQYQHEIFATKINFEFPIIKILDYKTKWNELVTNQNPFSIVVRTHLKALETTGLAKKRLKWKLRIYKALCEEGYKKQQIIDLFHFMDWMLTLPENIAKQFDQAVTEYEEKKTMRYVTSVEKHGIEKGIEKGKEEGKIEGRMEGRMEGIIKEKKEVVLRAFKAVGKNLDTLAVIAGLKKDEVKLILKQAGML